MLVYPNFLRAAFRSKFQLMTMLARMVQRLHARLSMRSVGHCAYHLGELFCGAIRSGKSKMLPRLRFHRAEHIGRAAPFVLVVEPRLSAWLGPLGRAHIGMQGHRLLIQANHG